MLAHVFLISQVCYIMSLCLPIGCIKVVKEYKLIHWIPTQHILRAEPVREIPVGSQGFRQLYVQMSVFYVSLGHKALDLFSKWELDFRGAQQNKFHLLHSAENNKWTVMYAYCDHSVGLTSSTAVISPPTVLYRIVADSNNLFTWTQVVQLVSLVWNKTVWESRWVIRGKWWLVFCRLLWLCSCCVACSNSLSKRCLRIAALIHRLYKGVITVGRCNCISNVDPFKRLHSIRDALRCLISFHK